MQAYADSLHFCKRRTGDANSRLWFSCEHLRDGAMNVLEGTGLMFFSMGQGDRGYAIQTCDPAYAKALTDELAEIGFKESRSFPTGAVYASRKYKGLEVIRTSKTIPMGGQEATSWAFTIGVK